MKVSIIGLGHRGLKHLDAVLQSKKLSLLSICDTDHRLCADLSLKYHVKAFSSVEALLNDAKPDIAIVAVPHAYYLPIIKVLSENGVHIIKEKPFATSFSEAKQIDSLVKKYQIHMMITCQRRFDLLYQCFESLLKQIGYIYHIEGKYYLNIANLEEGWRASKALSCGGALMDMGYHYLDLLLWFFGTPDHCQIKMTKSERNGQRYEVEDTVILSFAYQQKFKPENFQETIGSFVITRAAHKCTEKLIVRGSLGTVILSKDKLVKLNLRGEEEASLVRNQDIFNNPLVKQIEHFANYILGNEKKLQNHYEDHFEHVRIIENAYQQMTKPATSTPDYVWPILTDATHNVVKKQLNTNISIYDRSGIIKEFEDKFANYHNQRYALMTNSGTNAIFALYEGIALQPGDEVIVPAYTFFATASPLMYLGAIPIFCDCLPNGTIDPEQIRKKITEKTKAIMVTHMWGLPCEMDEICKIARENKLFLLEDCSHAHGAKYKNQLVGTFGDAAAWSLQGQKIISGGEGGILTTNNQDIYVRAQLQGQYNKRCKQEIPNTHPLSQFSLTGFGLKMRVHPLAAAIANEQFDHLDEFLEIKNYFARYITYIPHFSSAHFLNYRQLKNRQC